MWSPIMTDDERNQFRVSCDQSGVITIEFFGGDTSEEHDREFVDFIREKADCSNTIVIAHIEQNVVRVFKTH
jgi:hypothetical protein